MVQPYHTKTNWQNSMESTASTLRYLFDSKELSDASFRLVNEKGKAELVNVHKLVLAARSSVFEAMFYGASPEKNMPIVVDDVSAEIFKTMLRYLYKDDTACINVSDAWKFLYIAHKYAIESLKEYCSKIAAHSLTANNLFHCLQQANLFQAESLAKVCYDFIDINTTQLLSSAQFLGQPQVVVNSILERSTLAGMPEKCIYKAVLRWAEAEESRRSAKGGSSKNKSSIRDVLGSTLYLIRFPLLGPVDIVQARKEGVLSAEETADLLATSHGVESALLPFNKTHRSQASVVGNSPRYPQPLGQKTVNGGGGVRSVSQCGLCNGQH